MGARFFVAVVVVAVALSGCTSAAGQGSPTPVPTTAPSGVSTGAPTASPPATAAPTATSTKNSTAASPSATAGPASSSARPSRPVDVDPTPLPKVQRSGTSQPTVSAAPADTGDEVVYRDGVTLRITDIEFGEETKEGPGRFPGREYAILALEIGNDSAAAISLDTAVVTVLDNKDQPVAPVYVEEADVSDFAGKVAPGGTTTARYAFAVPKSSRSQVTVVVDFDSVHTSAVFSGELR